MKTELSKKTRIALALHPQDSYIMPKPPGAALPPQKHWNGSVYDGAELRPYTGRDDALDAYQLPSKGACS